MKSIGLSLLLLAAVARADVQKFPERVFHVDRLSIVGFAELMGIGGAL